MSAEQETDMNKTIELILQRLRSAAARRPADLSNWPTPRLVAVSKTKPAELIVEAYNCGMRHFGENYIEELLEKSTSPLLRDSCPEIKWHFIGHLQRGKVNKLLAVPNLYLMETIDSVKLADAIEQRLARDDRTMNILLQVNTSREENKNGVPPEEVLTLVNHVRENCARLLIRGLMTIGSYDNSTATTSSTGQFQNPDFDELRRCHLLVSEALDMEPKDLELSMGMSHDYEVAVEMGSSNVRVGSLIFGARNYNK